MGPGVSFYADVTQVCFSDIYIKNSSVAEKTNKRLKRKHSTLIQKREVVFAFFFKRKHHD